MQPKREERCYWDYRLLNGTVRDGDFNNVDYHLSDSVNIEIPKGNIWAIEAVSMKEVAHSQFDQRVAEARDEDAIAMMPLCLFDELKAMNSLMSPEERDDAMFLWSMPRCCGIFVKSTNNNFQTSGVLSK